jgi:hypothetical protein
VTSKGNTAENYGAQRKSYLTSAVGKKLIPDLYGTLTIPYVKNSRNDRSKSGVGDVGIDFRYAIFLQNFATPIIPQWQVSWGYKAKNSRSIQDSEDEDYLDVFGTGFEEYKLGADVWWGMALVKGGFSHGYTYAKAQSYQGREQQPGLSAQTVVSVGAEEFDTVSILGLKRLTTAERKLDGTSVDDSEVVNHSIYWSISYKYTILDVFKFTWTKTAAFGSNKNTVKSNSYLLAFTKAWL